jgi:DNA-binding MurR/RpiR family transcriptional regulator
MFRERIRKHYDHLSRSYRRVADFILTDYHSAAFMTAAGLAHAVDVDTTTVVRFAQRLGYPGFPELIEDIQDQVKTELGQTYVAPVEDATLQAQVQHYVAEDRSNLEKALAHNSLDAIEQMLDLLRAAPRIIVVSESFAAPVAESFALMLKEAGLPATYVSGDIYARAEALTNLVRKDVVIGVTPLAGPSGVARTLQFARSDGATTLACAPSLNSEAARAADHLLYAPGEPTDDQSIPSLTSLYSLLTAMARALSAQQAADTARHREQVNRVLRELA